MKSINKPTFEESIPIIDGELNKRRYKWHLTAVAWMNYEDVCQIIRLHIFNKWHLYDPNRPLAHWVNSIITAKIRNLLRDHWGNYASPCNHCAASEPGGLCSVLNGKQSSDCGLYAKWEKGKKQAYNVKLPVSLENHIQEVHDRPSKDLDVLKFVDIIHEKLVPHLKPLELTVYKYIFIEDKTDEEVAKLMGYKTSETGRVAGYKTIREIKRAIIGKARKLMEDGEVEIY